MCLYSTRLPYYAVALPVKAYYIAQVKETIAKLMAAVRALPPLSMAAINATARLALPQIGCCNPKCDRQAARPQYQASEPPRNFHHSMTAPCLQIFTQGHECACIACGFSRGS